MFVALFGWYLLPPAMQLNGVPWPNAAAPISTWTIAKSFDSARACETEVDRHLKLFEDRFRKVNHRDEDRRFWSQLLVTAAVEATCIETDDPRLRNSSEAPAKGQTRSAAN